MASWYGTDLFLANFKNRDLVAGYFSYLDGDNAKCIFFSNLEKPTVLGTISFDSSYKIENAIVDLSERDFTKEENDLYQIRKLASETIGLNEDNFFSSYENTSLNLIPLIAGKEKKVYVLTGPSVSGVVIFGNDYLLTFDKDNKIVTKKQLHKNIIPIEYGKNEVTEAIHSHLPETGDFITATDICTLMLYEKFAKWKSHLVISKDYVSIWNCETDQLIVPPISVYKKILEHNEKEEK
jgi:hypothetical protein